MSSVQLSENLYNNLKQDHVWDHREVVFLAHSLGGILVEEMLHPPPLRRRAKSGSSSPTEPPTTGSTASLAYRLAV